MGHRSIIANIMLPEDTYQRRNLKLFIAATICGFKWPGSDEFIKNKISNGLFTAYCFLNMTQPVIYCLANFWVALFYPLPLTVLIVMFRRSLAVSVIAIKLFYHSIPYRRRIFEQLFKIWNFEINADGDKSKREEMLKCHMIVPKRLFTLSVSVGVFLVQVPLVMLFFDRNMRGAENTYFRHDPNAWYHFWLVGLQLYVFFVSNLASQIYNFLIILLMTMAEVQLQLLRQNLHTICQNIPINSSRDVQREINQWVRNHQKTLKWINDLKDYLNVISTVKFGYLAAYSCLVVFTMPGYIAAGNFVDVMLIAFHILTNFMINFYESRMADKIYEKSNSLFDDAYTSNWVKFPKSVTKCLSIIQTQTRCRPIQIKSFSFIPDNSATFLDIMRTAYKALSFLLQLDIF